MREILYRGKRVDNGEWVEGWLQPFTQGGYIGLSDRLCIVNGMQSNDIYEVFPETVGEYTGLTDKNGKKIFEGYIVKVEYFSDWCENFVVGNGVIVWDLSLASFFIEIKGDILSLSLSCHAEIEIIGNIHDSPELLEEK